MTEEERIAFGRARYSIYILGLQVQELSSVTKAATSAVERFSDLFKSELGKVLDEISAGIEESEDLHREAGKT